MKKKKDKPKKIRNITLITIGIIIILFIIYIFTFIIFRPFMGEITQDRPIMKKLCEMQVACQSSIGKYRCSYKNQLRETSVSHLEKWEGYKGCNESTKGYGKNEDVGYIVIEACTCGGLN